MQQATSVPYMTNFDGSKQEIRMNILEEAIMQDAFEQQKVATFNPKIGNTKVFSYSYEGSQKMIPIKIFPIFTPK